MIFLSCILVILALKINSSASQTCQALTDVEVLIQIKNGTKFKKVVNGCIQRIEFGNNTMVEEAYVKEQQVKKLGRDTVRNMKHLKTVSFVKCETDSISPIAFRNVPNLLNIEVSRCKLKEITRDIFTYDLVPKLETLTLDRNEINFIEDRSFSNLTGLKKIDCHENQLDFWRQEWFDNTPNLDIMDFSHNSIRALPRRAFVELRNLRQIYFDYNDIMKIHHDAFKEIRSLEYLGLAHNKLTALKSDSFPNTVRIETFTINANYLNYLSNAVLKKLAAVKILMDYNPWKCECLDRINYWLYIKNGKSVISDVCKGSHIPICAASLNSTGTCSDTVDDEVTQRYIGLLKNLSTPLDPSCAKLEWVVKI